MQFLVIFMDKTVKDNKKIVGCFLKRILNPEEIRFNFFSF